MLSNFTYRTYQQKDLPGIFRLWESEANWGKLTEEIWNEWFVRTPHGPCTVIVALDEREEVVGQIVFTPSRVLVDASEVKAARAAAPIISARLRSGFSIRNFNHPALRLFLYGTKVVHEQGVELLYSLPNPSWLPLLRWVAQSANTAAAGIDTSKMTHTSEYQCLAWRRSALRDLPENRWGWRAETIAEYGAEHGNLWQMATERLPITCGVVRSTAWLRYKYGGHLSVEVRDERGELRGFAAIKESDGLLADILAATVEDLKPVLIAVLHYLFALNPPSLARFDEIKALETAPLSPLFRGLQFTPIDYKFGFFCGTLNEQLAQAIHPDRWHLTAGD